MKTTAFYPILSLVLFGACAGTDLEKENLPPSDFEVTSTIIDNGTSISLSWTEAIDPDGDVVTYSIVHGDTLARGLVQRNYIVRNIAVETDIDVQVIASDQRGGKVSKSHSARVEYSDTPYLKFANPEFEAYLVHMKIDDVVDGRILKSAAHNLKSLGIDAIKLNGLNEIAVFENLETLFILSENNFSTLNLTGNTKLKELRIQSNNKLKSIDLSKNTQLAKIEIKGCILESIDLSQNTLLASLDLSDNNLSAIDLSKNKQLKELNLIDNGLSSIDISALQLLHTLKLDNNRLTEIDIRSYPQVTALSIGGPDLKVLNLHANLLSLSITNVGYQQTQLPALPKLTSLHVANNLSTINLALFPALKDLNLSKNNLNSVDLSKNTALTNVNVLANPNLKNLDLGNLPLVRSIFGDPNQLESICIYKGINYADIYVNNTVLKGKFKTCY